VASRRAAGEGSVHKRKQGGWQGSTTVGIVAGQRRRKTVYGATQREVLDKLAAIRRTLPDAQLMGLDVNAEAVAAGVEATGLDLRRGDEASLADLQSGAFDLVFTVSVLDHIADVDVILGELLRCARQALYLLEVDLPVEGKVVRHRDHAAGEVRESTGASYSWDLARRLGDHPRVWRLDKRPIYLHPKALGPYYTGYLAWLQPEGQGP